MAIDPRMITLAREAQGWNQTRLAGVLNVTQGYLSKIESGNAEADDDLVERIANALECPRGLFSYTGPTAMIEVTCLHHRRRASTMSAPTKKRIEALARLTRISVEGLMSNVSMLVEQEVPRSEADHSDPTDVARAVRRALNLQVGPIADLLKVVEGAGVLIVMRPLGTAAQDAVSTWPVGGRPMMLVNSGLSPDRLRFTVAHELGHLVMHHAPSDKQEDEANVFASEFLAPADEILPDLADLGVGDMARLMQLKSKWGMSIAALVRRAHDLDLIDESRYRDYQIRLSRLGWRQAEPGNLALESPHLLRSAIEALRDAKNLDVEALASIALMTPQEFARVFLPDETNDVKVVIRSA